MDAKFLKDLVAGVTVDEGAIRLADESFLHCINLKLMFEVDISGDSQKFVKPRSGC